LLFPTKSLINLYDEKPFGSTPKMGTTLIVKCPKCGGLMLTAKAQKTKICPHCSTHVNLLRVQRIAAAQTAIEASEILRKLKTAKGFTK
jgi:acetyl-CoA carboxylase beta subunit